MLHYPGHQQALIKDNICIVVLSLTDHESLHTSNVLNRFEYDTIIDTCSLENKDNIVPANGASWDGVKFNIKPFESWILGADLNWHSPIGDAPAGTNAWNEEEQIWFTAPVNPEA